jgi:hypothetical protein
MQRFHPIGKIEEYWSEKPATFNVPDLDVKVSLSSLR